MAEPGDIQDTFDDEGFRRSLEAADKDGKWRDLGARFDDPKIAALAKQLAEAPRANYTERRLAELDRRAAQKHAAEAARANPAKPASPFTEARTGDQITPDWRAAAGKPQTPSPAPSAVPPAAEVEPRRHAENVLLAWVATIAAAFVVFAMAVGVHGAIAGFTPGMVLRAAAAALMTSIGWQLFGNGRFRCAAIGTSAHLVAFVSTCDVSERMQLFATFLGALVALLGSGAAGMMREEGQRTPRRAN